jgi:hypothetical protein
LFPPPVSLGLNPLFLDSDIERLSMLASCPSAQWFVPIVGRVRRAAYSGFPGNPVAALVSWLTLGDATIAALAGTAYSRRRGL